MFGPIRNLAAAAVVAALGLPQGLHAQSYPARSVTLVVPSAAGGGTDTIARVIGDQLSKQLGQGFVVENRTGAGMLAGTTAVAKAAPDGYTLLVGLNGNMTVNPSLFAKLPYDPVADFTAGRHARDISVSRSREQRPAGEIDQGADRLSQGKPRQSRLRVGRQRHRPAPRTGAVQDDDRHPDGAHRLSRRATRVSGRDLRPRAGVLRQHVDGDGALPGKARCARWRSRRRSARR